MSALRMSLPIPRTPSNDPVTLLFDRDEGTSALYRGVVVTTWRTWMRTELLGDAIGAIERAAELHRGAVALLTIYQLDRRFPIGVDFRSNLADLARTLQRIRPLVRACAAVTEFDGFLASAFRLATRAVVAAGAPSLELRTFTSRVDGVRWLGDRLPAVHATAEAQGELLGVSRFVSRWRDDHDAAGPSSAPPAAAGG
jgi:hypothetical protein